MQLCLQNKTLQQRMLDAVRVGFPEVADIARADLRNRVAQREERAELHAAALAEAEAVRIARAARKTENQSGAPKSTVKPKQRRFRKRPLSADELSVADLKRRGWCRRTIDALLGQPDQLVRNPVSHRAAPMRVYRLDRTRIRQMQSLDNVSPARVKLAYALAVAAYNTADFCQEFGFADTRTAKVANRSYRIAGAWLLDHDLLHMSTPFNGSTIADEIRSKAYDVYKTCLDRYQAIART